MDMTVLFLTGIGVCYALLILVGFRHQRQQRKAVPFNAKMMESHFSLAAGACFRKPFLGGKHSRLVGFPGTRARWRPRARTGSDSSVSSPCRMPAAGVAGFAGMGTGQVTCRGAVRQRGSWPRVRRGIPPRSPLSPRFPRREEDVGARGADLALRHSLCVPRHAPHSLALRGRMVHVSRHGK